MQHKTLTAVRKPVVVGLAAAVALVGAFSLGRVQAQDEAFRLDTPTLLYVQIKPDKTADYEAVIAKLRQGLQKTEDASLRQAARGWKVFKADAAANGNTLYVHVVDPPAANADYRIMQILYDAFPEERTALYEQYRDAFVGQSAVKLSLVANLGQ
jgi:hypothetical protein